MEDKLRLLVFDNCEHVVDAAADLIEAVLAKSTTVRILATSRAGLGVADQQMWPVTPLDVDASAKLFVERAQSVSPRFTPAADSGRVAEICRRLDGIPFFLSIELAASRVGFNGGERGVCPAGSAVQAIGRLSACDGPPSDAAPCRGVVLRSAR